MTEKELKQKIQEAINDFSTKPVFEASYKLFDTLGYNTKRRAPFPEKTYRYFKDSFLTLSSSFDENKALVNHWKSIDLLFQLTKEEIVEKNPTFTTQQVNNTIIESYLFFSIELSQKEYTRTQLAQITREINKVFPMPALIVFQYGENITLSVIHRRLNKKDAQKDVLEKVTLIKDISITQPHRAHIEILFDLSFYELLRVHRFTNFVDLHNAWQKTLDTQELNKRFYRDLSHWYFWALQEVHFPTNNAAADKNSQMQQEEKVKEHNAQNLIRLLTRLLFVWFVKEKKLIPEELFDENYLKEKLLKDFDPRKKEKQDTKTQGSKYYRAILQNLFFATLNQTMGKREFRKEGQQRNITNLMRYENYFKNPQLFIQLVEEKVPFMNGGLFECLDGPDPELKGKMGGDVIIYQDGFSDREDNPLCVPDYLFFGTEEHADLSEELGDKKQKDVIVRGLIPILKSYKFTVTENTPIEEDIALDPELLGRVFENLLASYNPETKTTARKQTGSFYTPREIVNYMVDESLKAYLKQKLVSEVGMKEEEAEASLELLMSYNEKQNPFDKKQTEFLIQAIDNCKIIDPACGSGAFPMGILHKMVHILHKLDPENNLWKERQIEKVMAIEDSAIREKLLEEIESAFKNNELDYGRKLYLIENCIYGVDIQPIAIQISKLRFFLSLIVDQKVFGILPLPNLETKFVAANALIGIEKFNEASNLANLSSEVSALEKKLENIRHRLFSAKTPSTKRKLREEDQEIREQISQILQNSGWGKESARQLALWDPYNTNKAADWFEPEWMFGVKEGFDIVIGNPPYVQLQKLRGNPLQNEYKKQNYKVHDSNGDIYCLFYEKGLNLLKNNGILCFITSNKWMRAGYGEKLRDYFTTHCPLVLIDLGPGVFESATVDTNILIIKKGKTKEYKGPLALTLNKNEENTVDIAKSLKEKGIVLTKLSKEPWFIGSDREQRLKEKIERIGKPLKEWDVNIYRGVLTGLNEAFIIDQATRDRLVAEDPKSAEILKPILRGRDIKRYSYEWAGLWLIQSGFDIDVPKKYPAIYKHLLQFEEKAKKRDDQGQNWWNLRACAYYPEFEKEKVVWQRITHEPTFCFVDPNIFILDSMAFFTAQNYSKYFGAVLNSNIISNYVNQIVHQYGTTGFRLSNQYVEIMPIPPVTDQNQPIVAKIESLVDQILSAKKVNPNADTTDLEREIDHLVYKLYDLTEEEIKIVEKDK